MNEELMISHTGTNELGERVYSVISEGVEISDGLTWAEAVLMVDTLMAPERGRGDA